MENIRIAIADDHTIVRKGLASMLNDDNRMEVIADAPNGRELIQLLERIKPPADLCLLDVNMPVMDGYDTLVALKEKYPEMRFLVLTQHGHADIVVKMLRRGATGYLLKDTEPIDLKHAILTIMANQYYQNDLIAGHLKTLVSKDKKHEKPLLTDHEEQFLKLCCSDLSYKEIGGKMGITDRTVAFYRQALFTKLEVKSRTGLALYALKLGYIPMNKEEPSGPAAKKKG